MVESDFAGIEDAQSSPKLAPIRKGLYLLEILALKKVQSRSKGKMFIGEFKVHESAGEGANEVGSSTSHVIKMSLDSALGNIKNLAAAAVSEPESNVTSAMLDKMVSDNQPAKGVKVRAEAIEITTRAGNPFTLVKYTSYEPPTKTRK